MDYSRIPSPCFVLDETLLRKNLAILGDLQTRNKVTLLHALKAFSAPAALSIINEEVDGAAASSLWEAKLAYEAFDKRVYLYAPAYRADEWRELCELSAHITFNSIAQCKHLIPLAPKGGSVSFGLRVNPECSVVSTALYDPSSPQCRLGVLHSELGSDLPDGIEGLHVHALCEGDASASERIISIIIEKFGSYLTKCRWLNLGGGHLATRAGYDHGRLETALKDLHVRFPQLEIILEPGAAIVWDTGVLVSTVLDIFHRPDHTMVILDVSFTAHMPDCLEMPYKPVVRGARDPGPGDHQYILGGQTCLAGDQLGRYAFDKEPQVGDRVIFEDMMHYTMVKTTMFNGVHHPTFAIVRTDRAVEVVKKYSYEDYFGRT